MIFRLARYVFLVTVIILGAFGINLFPGKVHVNWLGYDINMDVSIFITIVLGFVSILLITLSLSKWLLHLPQKFWDYRQKKKAEKADRTSFESLSAFAAGELEEAEDLSTLSLKLNANKPLALIVAAQTAYNRFMDGSEDAHKSYMLFSQLAENDQTKFLGMRGLILIAQQQKNNSQLLSLLEQTYLLRPNSPWVMQQLLDYDLRNNRLEKAESMLDQMLITQAIPADKANRLKAHISWQQAQQSLEEKDFDEFYEAVNKAINLRPDLMEATFALARYYAESDRESKALKVLRQGYSASPSLKFEPVFLDILKAYTPIDALRIVIKSTESQVLHPQTFLLRASFALKAHLWGEARQYLDKFKEHCTINRPYCLLMQELEMGQNPGHPNAAQSWLERAHTFPEDLSDSNEKIFSAEPLRLIS